MVGKKQAEAAGKVGKPMFVQLVLEPVWKAYSALDEGPDEGRVRWGGCSYSFMLMHLIQIRCMNTSECYTW